MTTPLFQPNSGGVSVEPDRRDVLVSPCQKLKVISREKKYSSLREKKKHERHRQTDHILRHNGLVDVVTKNAASLYLIYTNPTRKIAFVKRVRDPLHPWIPDWYLNNEVRGIAYIEA